MSNKNGMDEMQNKLKKMANGARELEEESQIPVTDILTDSFIAQHTSFNSAQELFDESWFELETAEDFQSIPDEKWDQYIAEVSSFDSWAEMLQSAMAEYVRRKMGLSS